MIVAGVTIDSKFLATAFAASGLMAAIAVLLPSWVIVEPPPPEPPVAVPAPIVVGPATEYAAISMRPLFNIERRRDPPPPPPAPPKPPPLPSVGNYRLVGLILSPDLRMALVMRRQDGREVQLREGDALDGWTVKEINATGVRLSGAGAATELTIPKAASSGLPAMAMRPVAGATPLGTRQPAAGQPTE
jgi:general secretion pathway protein N